MVLFLRVRGPKSHVNNNLEYSTGPGLTATECPRPSDLRMTDCEAMVIIGSSFIPPSDPPSHSLERQGGYVHPDLLMFFNRNSYPPRTTFSKIPKGCSLLMNKKMVARFSLAKGHGNVQLDNTLIVK